MDDKNGDGQRKDLFDEYLEYYAPSDYSKPTTSYGVAPQPNSSFFNSIWNGVNYTNDSTASATPQMETSQIPAPSVNNPTSLFGGFDSLDDIPEFFPRQQQQPQQKQQREDLAPEYITPDTETYAYSATPNINQNSPYASNPLNGLHSSYDDPYVGFDEVNAKFGMNLNSAAPPPILSHDPYEEDYDEGMIYPDYCQYTTPSEEGALEEPKISSRPTFGFMGSYITESGEFNPFGNEVKYAEDTKWMAEMTESTSQSIWARSPTPPTASSTNATTQQMQQQPQQSETNGYLADDNVARIICRPKKHEDLRPSYSDVLAKSVGTSQQPSGFGSAACKNSIFAKVDPFLGKCAKTKKEPSKVGTATVLKRQLSTSAEESQLNASKRTPSERKSHGEYSDAISSWQNGVDPFLNNGLDGVVKRSPLANLNRKDNIRKSARKLDHSILKDKLDTLTPTNDTTRVSRKIGHEKNIKWGVGTPTPSPSRIEKKPIVKTTSNSETVAVKRAASVVKVNGVGNLAENLVAECLKPGNASAAKPPSVRPPFSSAQKLSKTVRTTKRRESSWRAVETVLKRWKEASWNYGVLMARWFLNLLLEVFSMALHLSLYSFSVVASCGVAWVAATTALLDNMGLNPALWWKLKQKSKLQNSLYWTTDSDSACWPNNLVLPTSSEELMKRVLACKSKDPYSILGVSKYATDDVLRRYYKRQGILVHPDKNSQLAASETFTILVTAYNLVCDPEKRRLYDRCHLDSTEVDEAWAEITDQLQQLHAKMEYTANTIRCTNCNSRHKRMPVNRPLYASRFCSQCKIRHSSKEGDIWAESLIMGWMWRYYACMEGMVYDISDWASCQGINLRHLKANTHVVQYRIVVGKNKPNQLNNLPCPTPTAANVPPVSPVPPPVTSQPPASQANPNDPNLEEILSSLYGNVGITNNMVPSATVEASSAGNSNGNNNGMPAAATNGGRLRKKGPNKKKK